MDNVSFPSEMKALAAFEKSLDADLSLEQMEKIGEQILNVKTTGAKTAQIGHQLLNRLEAKKDQVVQQRLDSLSRMQDPVKKIKELQSLMYFLPPEEIDRQFSAIEMEAGLLSGKDQKIKDVLEQQLQHLQFKQEKPVVHELDEYTPHNFVEKVQNVANAIRNMESLEPLKEFSQAQINEIFRISNGRGA